MNWQQSKLIATKLLERIHGDVQGRTIYLVDAPGLSFGERRQVMDALARELRKRGAIVRNLWAELSTTNPPQHIKPPSD
jgi:hypothetical protein